MILLTDSGLTLPGLPVSPSCSYVHRNKPGYKDTCGIKKKKKAHIHIWYLLDKNRCRHINTARFKQGESSESSHERMAPLHLDLCTTETPSSASRAQSAAAGGDKPCLLSTRESQRHLVLAVEVLTGLGQDGGCSGSAPVWIPEASRTELRLLLHTGHVRGHVLSAPWAQSREATIQLFASVVTAVRPHCWSKRLPSIMGLVPSAHFSQMCPGNLET